MASTRSEILETARTISVYAGQIVSYLEEHEDKTPPNSSISNPIPAGPSYDALRNPLSDAAQNLLLLVNGPLNWLRLFFCSHHDLAAWQVALDFDFFEAVPLEGSVLLSEIAEKVVMDEDRVGRVMRLLASQRVFVESQPDVFRHTATSALVASDKAIKASIAMQLVSLTCCDWKKISLKRSLGRTKCFKLRPRPRLVFGCHQRILI